MPSDLETSMETLIKVFHRYASKEGDTGTLSRKELKTLMEAELAGFLKVPLIYTVHATSSPIHIVMML